MALKYLLEKEVKQIIRNGFLPRMILLFPLVMMFVMPWATSMEVKDINVSIVDNDHSTTSRRIVDEVNASKYFIASQAPDYKEAFSHIEQGKADAILEIPLHYERDLVRGDVVHPFIAANTVNGTKGGLSGSYLSQILLRPTFVPQTPVSPIRTRFLFNPHRDYRVFMIPALMAMLLTIMCGFLPALNVVGEKEIGTMEQINVTPVSKFSFILAKLLPYWVIGFITLFICIGLGALVYGIVPEGSLLTLSVFAGLFVLTLSSMGLVVSNYSVTMQQAMFVMWFFLMIFILMSGLFTPISSMPDWGQVITWFNPLSYFMLVLRSLFLKGSTFADLLPQFYALTTFAVIFNAWAIVSYRKR